MNVFVRDIEHLWRELSERDAGPTALSEQSYGVRDFSVTLPDGHRLRFNESVE